MSEFEASCYDDKGNVTMTEAERVHLMEDKVSQEAAIASMTTEISEMEAAAATAALTIAAHEATIAELRQAECSDDGTPTWAIAVIAIMCSLFGLTIVILGLLVSKEKAGKPIFMAIKTPY